MVAEVIYSVRLEEEQKPYGLSVSLDLQESERLRRFLAQHNVGEDDMLRARVYLPLVEALDKAEVFGECEEDFHHTRRLIADEVNGMLLATRARKIENLVQENRRLRRERDQAKRAHKLASDTTDAALKRVRSLGKSVRDLREENKELRELVADLRLLNTL